MFIAASLRSWTEIMAKNINDLAERVDPAMAAVSASRRHHIWIRYALPGDEEALLANMRRKDVAECRAMGMSPGRALRTSIKNSLYVKSVWLDDTIIAMLGLGGSIISDVGCAWMLTGNGIERVPVSFARVARFETDQMLKYKKTIFNYVSEDYPEAAKFFDIIGFHVSQPVVAGKNGNMFHQITKSGV
jgi:hypothetical protein